MMPFSLLNRRIACPRRLSGAALAVILGVVGCRSHNTQNLSPASVRSSGSAPASVNRMQATPQFQEASRACKRHDYRRAAELLQILATTPGLTPEAVAYVQRQRAICLKDAGLLPAVPPNVSVSPHAPADADCGPRALLIACRQVGVKTTLERLRQAAGTTAQGTTLEGLQQAAQQMGLHAEGVQVSREALPDTGLPALAWVHRDHYVALLSLSGSGDQGTATIRDPNQPAEEILSQEQLLQRCGGYLLLVHR